MTPPVTVGEYLDRIGLAAEPEPTLDWLAAAQAAHLTAVPFENLDIHLGTPITLDEDLLLDKVVRRRRGGFCYELNGTFAWLLRQIGFPADLLEARVAVDDRRYTDPFDHAVVRVWIDGAPWHADVGFGDHARMPFPMDEGAVHREGGRSWRWVGRIAGHLDLDVRRPGGDWSPDHRMSLAPHVLADFADRCRWQQTSPDSHFTTGPVCTLARPDGGRVSLADDRLITTAPDGTRGEVTLDTDAEILGTYRDRFGLDLPHRPGPRRGTYDPE
jgi:N-hydroxyarylamine O-acetyltransferase